jgi:general stress protein YciG
MAEDRDRRRGGGSSHRGFAAMDEAKQREIARQGGRSVPDEKRSFSRDRELAAEAGRKGGESVPPQERSFSQNRQLAAEAGRKGGRSRGRGSRRKAETPGSEKGGKSRSSSSHH